MRKISALFAVLLMVSIYGLAAQTSARDFDVDQRHTYYMGNFPNWNAFVDTTNNALETMRRISASWTGVTLMWVVELTTMENDLVNRALREVPTTAKGGSGYRVVMKYDASSYSLGYDIFFYCAPDGKRYYRLLYMQTT